MTDQPRVMLDVDVMWCSRHLEPFRKGWPAGYVAGVVELFKEALKLDAIAAACPTTEDGQADATFLNVALSRFAPICCFVSREARADVYAKAGVRP